MTVAGERCRQELRDCRRALRAQDARVGHFAEHHQPDGLRHGRSTKWIRDAQGSTGLDVDARGSGSLTDGPQAPSRESSSVEGHARADEHGCPAHDFRVALNDRFGVRHRIRPGSEVASVRKTLDSRYDDLKSGRVKPIDGEEAFRTLREKSERRRSGG